MEFLVFGTFWFWTLLVVTIVSITICMENAAVQRYNTDSGGGTAATITLLLAFTAYWFFGSSEHIKSIFGFIQYNPWTVIGFIVAYYVIGIAWSMGKWYFHLHGYKDYLETTYENRIVSEYTTIPSFANSKNRILSWMSYWPFSMIWTLLNNAVKKFFRFILNKLSSYYEGIYNNVFGEFNERQAELKRMKKENDDNLRKKVVNGKGDQV